MVSFKDWQENKDKWLNQDFALMTSDNGWKKRTQKNGIDIWQQSLADDKNDLFRWRLPNVAANHHEVYDVFVNKMIDYHHYWTKEYTGGFLVEKKKQRELDEYIMSLGSGGALQQTSQLITSIIAACIICS